MPNHTILRRPATAAPADTGRVPVRSEIDNRYKWNVDAIYGSDTAWEQDLAEVQKRTPELGAFKGRLAESAATLLKFMQTRDEVLQVAGRLAVYAHCRRDEDTRDSTYQGMADRIHKVGSTLGETLAYVAPELVAMDPARLEQFLAESEALRVYRHHLDDIVRHREHTLSPAEEKIIAMTSEMARGPQSVFSMLDNADLKFPTIKDADGKDIEITKGRYYRLMESPDRRVRIDTFNEFYGTYEKYKNTLSAALAGNVKRDLFYARVRKYDSALHAALAGYNIPVAVFENLVRTVGEHLEPLHRYGRLRKRVLKLDLLHAYDLAAPLVPEAEMTFSYEEATKLVREGLAPMGPEYGALLDRAFREGWIDVHESEGKRSGAYSTGTYGTSPYILLNFNGTLDAVFTLAHELGHSLHTYYAQSTQPFVYSDYAIFVAEVASTCAESLLMAHLLEQTTDRDRRLYLLNHWVEGIRGTFYTQVMFAEFEWEIHKRAEADEPLTHESLSAIFAELFGRYYGPELVHDKLNDYGWSRIPHFYYNFYVYQYATGYAAASALAQRIRKEGAQALEPYLEFLKSGSSAYPIELLERAGVDMTQPQPVVDTISLFDGLLGKMEELLPDAS